MVTGEYTDDESHLVAVVVVLTCAALTAFGVPVHFPRFDGFRAVDIAALMASGMCIGVALSALLRGP